MAMSDEHKAAIAQGRIESRAIKAYLTVLSRRRPGRPVTTDSLQSKIAGLQLKIQAESDALKRLELVQARLNAEDQLASFDDSVDMDGLEAGFVRYARSYSERKGISYSAWREVGVTAPVLKQAGVARTRRG